MSCFWSHCGDVAQLFCFLSRRFLVPGCDGVVPFPGLWRSYIVSISCTAKCLHSAGFEWECQWSGFGDTLAEVWLVCCHLVSEPLSCFACTSSGCVQFLRAAALWFIPPNTRIESKPRLLFAKSLQCLLICTFSQQPLSESPPICFRVVTRGDYRELVYSNVQRNVNKCLDTGLDNFIVEVVTDKSMTLPKSRWVRELVVPSTYKTKSGAMFKARALQYALESEVSELV